MLKTLNATRYITPLREGGSLPAVVETDDGSLFVMKFVGAGQGVKALIAEIITGEIARHLGLRVPEIALIALDPAMGHTEPNTEIQELLKRSAGLNLGLRYLPNACAYNALLQPPPTPQEASAIVWLDAYTTNVDRTMRNTNLLVWQEQLWLIDHGASLYFHYDWEDYLARSRSPFPLIKHHTLLPFAAAIAQADSLLRPQLKPAVIEGIINLIPDIWLNREPAFAGHAQHRQAYLAYLLGRLEASALFVEEAVHARQNLV